MFVSVLERQRDGLEDGCHHTVVWQRYVESLRFGLVGPTYFYGRRMCVTWFHSTGTDREYFSGHNSLSWR